MLQPFFSVYTKYYRNFEREPEAEALKPCIFYSDLKENFLPAEDYKPTYNAERDEAIIKELYLKKFITTYQLAYCSSEGKNSVLDPDDLDEDQFMTHFNHYFSKKTHPVLRPLDTFRRIFHYSRFDNYYTGKSTYEEDISREAYEFFKKDYDAGISRLFGKTRYALQTKIDPEKLEDKHQKVHSMPSNTCSGKEKICVVCCEKFGDFSCKPMDQKTKVEGQVTE